MPLKTKVSCPAAARARTARGAERLRQLQTAATEMFLDCGYDGVSVDGLIHRVGGSRRNVYGPYGGKQGLFVAAVRALSEEIAGQLTSLPMSSSELRPGLVLYGRRLLELLLQPRMLAIHRLMVSEGQRFPEQARSLCQTGRDHVATGLARWLAAQQDQGALRAGLDTAMLAHLYIDLVICGPQLRALVGELAPGWSAAGIARHVEASIDLFLHGAGPPAGAAPAASARTARRATPSPVPRKTRR